MAKAKRFKAALVRAGKLGWTIIYLPFDVQKTWGTRRQIRVKGEVNGFAFQTAAFPTKSGQHFVLINRVMQKGGRVTAGMIANFEVQPDTEVREINEPKELAAALKEDKSLLRWYEKLNDSTRRYFCRMVGAAKSAASRQRKAEQLAECMYMAMDAERELPPVISRMMDEEPKSYVGWKKMTPAMRRGELLGIFYYKNPGSQRKRIGKAIEKMVERAEKR